MSMAATDDLLHRALDGLDRERAAARDQLMGRLLPTLVLWASTRMSPMLKSRMEPEDVAQEIVARVLKGLDAFRAAPGAGRDRSFYGWLFTVGEHCIRDLVDHELAQKRRLPIPLAVSQTSPSQAAYRREGVDRMLRALDGLDAEDREVIRLIKLQGLTPAQVAPLLDKSVNAVRIQLCRALKALQARLTGLGASGPASAPPPAAGERPGPGSRSD
jgi:RNA polymerase sigma factor (sigma-70 family)